MPLTSVGGPMHISAIGINTAIPCQYKEVQRRLKELGIVPTGDPELDKVALKNEIDRRLEKFAIEKKEEKKEEEQKVLQKMEEQKTGAQALGVQNRIFFGI